MKQLSMTFLHYALFVCLCASGLAMPARAKAAGLAEEHTVLYYLIETQRRYKKTCGGNPMPDAPSLTPSQNLRALAAESIVNGLPPEDLAPTWGLKGAPLLSLSTTGATAQEAFRNLMQTECPSIMSPEYKFIGANYAHGRWVVLMSSVDARLPKGKKNAPLPVYGSGGDPAAPAEPIVTKVIELGPNGKPVGKVTPVDQGGKGTVTAPITPSQPKTREGVVPLTDTRAPDPSQNAGGTKGFGVFADDPATDDAPAAPGNAPAPATAPAPVNGQQPAPAGKLNSSSGSIMDMINAARAQKRMCGKKSLPAVPALKENSELSAIAYSHATDMTMRGYFASTSPSGRTLGERVSGSGYIWSAVAENLAAKTPSAQAAVHLWLENPNQCANIMGAEFTEAGAGSDMEGGHWSLILASPMEKGALRLE